MAKKIKQSTNKILKDIKVCINCYTPQYLKFNFTFLDTKCLPIQKNQKADIFDRIIYASQFTYNTLVVMGKYKGFELVPKNQIKDFAKKPSERGTDVIFEEGHRKLSDKCCILRLDDTSTTRFIGEVIKNIFYVFCIDFTGKAYDHGS